MSPVIRGQRSYSAVNVVCTASSAAGQLPSIAYAARMNERCRALKYSQYSGSHAGVRAIHVS